MVHFARLGLFLLSLGMGVIALFFLFDAMTGYNPWRNMFSIIGFLGTGCISFICYMALVGEFK